MIHATKATPAATSPVQTANEPSEKEGGQDFLSLLKNQLGANVQAPSEVIDPAPLAEHDAKTAQETDATDGIAILFAPFNLPLTPAIPTVATTENTQAGLPDLTAKVADTLPLTQAATTSTTGDSLTLDAQTKHDADFVQQLGRHLSDLGEEATADNLVGQAERNSVGAAATLPAPATFKPTVNTPTLPAIDVPVGKPGWHDAIGQRVILMSSQQLQSAEMHLNPPHLGPLEIQMTIKGGETSLNFVSPHLAVREAIAAARPQLIEMFAGSGLQLGNVDVGSQSQQQTAQSPFTPSGNWSSVMASQNKANLAEIPAAQLQTRWIRRDGGQVDMYA